MTKISVVVRTIDRCPRRNYLAQTIEQLGFSGMFRSPHLANFSIANGEGRTHNENCLYSLELAAREGADYILNLEDDIDVCDDFLGSVARWLDTHGEFPVYVFGSNWPSIEDSVRCGYNCTTLPDIFWGAQAYAVPMHHVPSLTNFLSKHLTTNGQLSPGHVDLRPGKDTHYHDMLLLEWARAEGLGPFMASAPSFVQHIGEESALSMPTFPTFPTFPGREWSYPNGNPK